MKKSIICLSLLLSFFLYSFYLHTRVEDNAGIIVDNNYIVTREIESFTKLSVSNALKVELVFSSENKIELIGINDPFSIVTLAEQNGKLMLSLNTSKMNRKTQKLRNNLRIKIYHTEPITYLSASSASRIFSKDTYKSSAVTIVAFSASYVDMNFHSDTIILKANSASSLKLNVISKMIRASLTSASEAYLMGVTDSLHISLSSASNLNAKKLEVKKADIECFSASDGKVTVSEKIQAMVYSASELLVYGSADNAEVRRDKTSKVVFSDRQPKEIKKPD